LAEKLLFIKVRREQNPFVLIINFTVYLEWSSGPSLLSGNSFYGKVQVIRRVENPIRISAWRILDGRQHVRTY